MHPRCDFFLVKLLQCGHGFRRQRIDAAGTRVGFRLRPVLRPREVAPALPIVSERFPQVRLSIVVEDRPVDSINVPGHITIKDTETTISAAKASTGLGCVLESRVSDELATGVLVNVMPAHSSYGEPFHIYYSSRRYIHPALREFINIIR